MDAEQALRYHEGGKIALAARRPLRTVEDLVLAYTPGVAAPVKEIARDPSTVFRYTSRSNLVAVVTDGTAILGLGDLGASASIPVMEGKAVLFKTFGDVDAWPVPLGRCRQGGQDTGPTDIERVIDATCALAPMYGGINLEDIAAPACFDIEERLDAMLDIPVFHDDQWGTAVIALAGIENYALLRNSSLEELRMVINGAGAAGIRIAEMLKAAGAKEVVLCDSRGVLRTERTDLNARKREHAVATSARTLSDAMRGAHVFIGVSVAGCLTPDDVRSMADYPAVFAMANPDPEIDPALVAEVLEGKPYVMATGRSDYANQVNNVLGFPFLFRGALDAGARSIGVEMKVAAAEALADLARQPVTEQVAACYGGKRFEFGPGYLIPKPFDERLFVEVSERVAVAAVAAGQGALPPGYRGLLEARNAERIAKRSAT